MWTDPVDAKSQYGRHHGDVPAVVESLAVLVESPRHHHQPPGVEDHQDDDHQAAHQPAVQAGPLLSVSPAVTDGAAEVQEAPETCQCWGGSDPVQQTGHAPLEVRDSDVTDTSSLKP